MRIASNMIFDAGVASIQKQTAALLHTQQQVSSGKRLLSPSDDPVAAARALDVTQASANNSQYLSNQKATRESLGLEENGLTSVGDLIQTVRTLAVQGGNAALSDSDRRSIATDLRQRFTELLGLSNATDGGGQYQFSGYMGATKPFSGSVEAGVVYAGDDGQRLMQVSSSRQIAASDSGNDVFMRMRNGNGTFVTAAINTNTGTGVVDGGTTLDPTKWNSAANNKNFTLRFAVNGAVPPVTTYDIVDNVSGNSLLTGAAPGAAPYPRVFQQGQAVNFKSQGAEPAFDFGAQLIINGQPASGDSFSVQASSSQSVFTTMANLVSALESSNSTPANATLLANRIGYALTNLDQASNNILTVRASVGSRMNELDSLANAGEDRNLQYQQSLSNLQDLDYAAAITKLTQQQGTLDAAQKSFLKVSGLSLFNFL